LPSTDPLLAEERARKREELLKATEKALEGIARQTGNKNPNTSANQRITPLLERKRAGTSG
jgi:ATP-dependent exoDNAse (exonuclease V) alpha subunit